MTGPYDAADFDREIIRYMGEALESKPDGVIDALLVQSPYQMGYQGVHLLKEFVDKGKIDNVDSYRE